MIGDDDGNHHSSARSTEYQLGKGAEADNNMLAWLGRIEKKIDRLTWQVAAIAAVVPLLTTVIFFLVRTELFGL